MRIMPGRSGPLCPGDDCPLEQSPSVVARVSATSQHHLGSRGELEAHAPSQSSRGESKAHGLLKVERETVPRGGSLRELRGNPELLVARI